MQYQIFKGTGGNIDSTGVLVRPTAFFRFGERGIMSFSEIPDGLSDGRDLTKHYSSRLNDPLDCSNLDLRGKFDLPDDLVKQVVEHGDLLNIANGSLQGTITGIMRQFNTVSQREGDRVHVYLNPDDEKDTYNLHLTHQKSVISFKDRGKGILIPYDIEFSNDGETVSYAKGVLAGMYGHSLGTESVQTNLVLAADSFGKAVNVTKPKFEESGEALRQFILENYGKELYH